MFKIQGMRTRGEAKAETEKLWTAHHQMVKDRANNALYQKVADLAATGRCKAVYEGEEK